VVCGNPSQSYGASSAIYDLTVSPATRHKWTYYTSQWITPYIQYSELTQHLKFHSNFSAVGIL